MIVCRIWEITDTTPTTTTIKNIYNGKEYNFPTTEIEKVKKGELEVSTLISRLIAKNRATNIVAYNKRLEQKLRKEAKNGN